MKNYADRGGCYPPRVKAKVDNVLRDLNSFLHRTTAECPLVNLVNILIQLVTQVLLVVLILT